MMVRAKGENSSGKTDYQKLYNELGDVTATTALAVAFIPVIGQFMGGAMGLAAVMLYGLGYTLGDNPDKTIISFGQAVGGRAVEKLGYPARANAIINLGIDFVTRAHSQ